MSDNYGLEKLHNTLIMMLKDIDKLCKENDIKYFSLFGTTLGAVRHKGFIPWDDDVDLGMYIDDYYKFIDICKTKLDKEKYYFELECTKDFPLPYCKIKLNNTTMVENFDSNLKHYGIFIDIFCYYDASENKLNRSIQYFNSRLLLARALADYQYKTNNILKKFTMILSKVFVNGFIKKMLKKSLTKGRDTKYCACFFDNGSLTKALSLKTEIFPLKLLPFTNDFMIPVPNDYNKYCEKLYGVNYMEIPSLDSNLVVQHNMYINYDKMLSYDEIKQLKL